MANIYEVAELAGVSLATVSRVINNPDGKVTAKTRQKVLDAMKKLGYQPNSIAQSLATRSSNSVGVLVSELHGPFFGAMLSVIEETLRAAGKFVLVAAGHSKEEQEREGIRFLVSRNCDALIVHVEALPDKVLVEQSKSTPIVVVNRKVRGIADRCFSLNNEIGGYLAAKSLLSLGHRKIAYISGPLNWVDAQQRLEGHKRALSEAGVKFDPRLLHEGDYHETGGSEALTHLFLTGVPFTAVICANDEMAAGAMAAAHDRGLRLPEELSIVGFDDAPISRYVYPKLSTVHYPIADMSRMAARWVLQNVYEQGEVDSQRVFQPNFVQRQSSSRLT
jgi:LacI family transcriptional regulator